MHSKTINKIVFTSLLTLSALYSNQIKSQELTAKQLQLCINKAEEIKRISESIEKIEASDKQFFKEIQSFELSLVAIEKYIEAHQRNYKDISEELIYKEFELEEFNEGTKEYNLIQKKINELKNIIERYTSTEYYQGLISTKKTLEKLEKDGRKYLLENMEKIYQDNKKLEKYKLAVIKECTENKTINPKIEKEVCEKNKNSFLCSKYK